MLRSVAGVMRAPFLLLPFGLVAVGASAAALEVGFVWMRTLLALVGLLGVHAGVNALNEVSDFRTGIDLHTRRTPFSGGSGTLPEGRITPRAATRVAVVGLAVGLVIGLWFLRVVGLALLPIVAVGALATLAYSTVLARAYVGEIFAGLGLGTLPVLGTAVVQTGELGPAAVAASVPSFFLTFNLLLLNEFPDEEADRRGGRRNLVLLLGRPRAAYLYGVAALSAPLTIVFFVLLDILPAICLAAVAPSLLLVPPLRWAVVSPEAEVPIPALGANVVWNLTTHAVLAGSLAFAALRL